LVKLEEVIDERMIYYNTGRRRSGIDYLTPVEYLKKEGIRLRPLVEIGPSDGSVLGGRAEVVYLAVINGRIPGSSNGS